MTDRFKFCVPVIFLIAAGCAPIQGLFASVLTFLLGSVLVCAMTGRVEG